MKTVVLAAFALMLFATCSGLGKIAYLANAANVMPKWRAQQPMGTTARQPA